MALVNHHGRADMSETENKARVDAASGRMIGMNEVSDTGKIEKGGSVRYRKGRETPERRLDRKSDSDIWQVKETPAGNGSETPTDLEQEDPNGNFYGFHHLVDSW